MMGTVKTGLAELDAITEGGWHSGELICFTSFIPRPLNGPRKTDIVSRLVMDHIEKGGSILYVNYEVPAR